MRKKDDRVVEKMLSKNSRKWLTVPMRRLTDIFHVFLKSFFHFCVIFFSKIFFQYFLKEYQNIFILNVI